MDMIQFSILPNDAGAVSLTPLRRATQRIQAVRARLTERGMFRTLAPVTRHCRGDGDRIAKGAAYAAAREMAAPAAARPRKRDRAGALPGRWPFPPAPTDVTHGPVAEATGGGPRQGGLDHATIQPVPDRVSVKSMALDVALVLAWGAMIPAFMWLGVAGGF